MALRSSDIADEFLDEVQLELRHEAQRTNFAWYLTGLLSPLERKSVEPIAGLVNREHIAKTQSTLLHFLAYGTWKDAPVRALATRFASERAAPIRCSNSDSEPACASRRASKRARRSA